MQLHCVAHIKCNVIGLEVARPRTKLRINWNWCDAMQCNADAGTHSTGSTASIVNIYFDMLPNEIIIWKYTRYNTCRSELEPSVQCSMLMMCGRCTNNRVHSQQHNSNPNKIAWIEPSVCVCVCGWEWKKKRRERKNTQTHTQIASNNKIFSTNHRRISHSQYWFYLLQNVRFAYVFMLAHKYLMCAPMWKTQRVCRSWLLVHRHRVEIDRCRKL